jgi:signal recognition particle receptor subunit beta
MRCSADEAVDCLYSTLDAASDDLADAPLLLFCNKQDVEGAMPAPMIAEKFDLDNRMYDRFSYCQALPPIHTQPSPSQACSGRTGEGVMQGVQWLTKTLSMWQ